VQPARQDEAQPRPPRFDPPDYPGDQDPLGPGFSTQRYDTQRSQSQGYDTQRYQSQGNPSGGYQSPDFEAQGYEAERYPTRGYQSEGYQSPGPAQGRDFGEQSRFDETRLDNARPDVTGLDSTRLDRVPVAEPKRPGRRRGLAAGGPDDPASTSVDQPQGGGIPVYQTGMQLVVPTGPEWTFRDPGTGAFPGVQPDRFGDRPQQDRFSDRAQQDRFGDRAQQDPYRRGGPALLPPLPPGARPAGQPAPRRPAPEPDGPDMGPAAPAGRRHEAPERKRGRKAPVLIGAGAVVVVLGIGAAVTAPRFLHHTDAGCAAYSTSALPAYNKTITDLNAQASQATLGSDLTTAIAQLSAAAGQAQGAAVKSALQGLLTQLTQVQTDVQKGSVPAATVAQLNTASAAADNAC
jgi:hypothetical protein